MDRKIAGLLGVAAALTTASAAYAAAPAPAGRPPPTNYQDLLTPVPIPIAVLRADDSHMAQSPAGEMKIAQVHYHHRRPPPPRRRRFHHR